MTKSDVAESQTSFSAVLRRALEHVHDPPWLAANSPLATPYFLGGRAPANNSDPHAAGRVLQALLYEAADSIWGDQPPPTRAALEAAVDEARRAQGNSGDEYLYLILEVRYLRRYFGPKDYPTEPADIPTYLAVSRTRFFVHLDEAVDRLGNILLRRVRPSIRLEQPAPPATLVGRSRELAEIRAALDGGQSVSLSGLPGAGKTALGATVSQGWPPGRVFYYTFLPSLNDNLGALLFALAHFTHERGATALWAYLAAKEGAIDPAQATGLLRGDLATLGDPPVLMVLDEIDLLRSPDDAPQSAAHAQLLFFLEGLIGVVPLLLIGQRGYLDTPVHLSLATLDEEATAALLLAAGQNLVPDRVRQIHDVTGGLPRLVWLVVALLRSGETVDDVTRLSLRGDATPLFHRLWRRLETAEMEMLVSLAPYRRPAPQDVWSNHAAACASLAERRLLELGDNGAIAVQPFFRRLVYQQLGPEQREQMHLHAGRVRGSRGDYTAAAHHFVAANEPETAVAVWFPNRALEISRGHAGAAREVFAGLSGKGLPEETQRRLKVIQNQLFLLAGDPERVISNIRSIHWNPDDTLSAEAYEQAARSSYVQGDPQAALDFYEQSLKVMGKHVAKMVNTHFQRGTYYLDQAELSEALVEVRRAEQRLALFKGLIARGGNRFGQAEEYFLAAQQMARELGDPDLVAQSSQRLAAIYSVQGRVSEAERCLDEAIAHYEQTGDRLSAEWLRVTLGGVYINARLFHEAIAATERAMSFLEKLGSSQYLAQPLAQLAEAYLETGQTDKALDYAGRVLEVDMPRYRPYAYYTLGLARQRTGAPTAAATAFADGLSAARANSDRFIEAYLLRNVGRLAHEQGDAPAAQEALSAALALFQEMGLGHEVEATAGDLASAAVG